VQVNFITETGRRCGASGSPNTAHTEHITRNGTGFLLFLTDTEKSPNGHTHLENTSQFTCTQLRGTEFL